MLTRRTDGKNGKAPGKRHRKVCLRQGYRENCEGLGKGERGEERCRAFLSLLRDWRLLLLRLRG